MITMFENHDMPRLQSLGASNEMLNLALCLLMTGRGVPSLFYGCEQYLHNDTDGGGDPYNRPMMEKWDTDTPAFQIIKALAPERGKNKALQWGGLWSKIVEKDLYVFVRKFHSFRCLVILNKGLERTIPEIDTELPNRTHYCLLTGTPLEVKEGRAVNVKVGTAQALVYSWLGTRWDGKTHIRVQLNGVNTTPGDVVGISGNCPELGEWDITRTVKMEYVNPNLWFTEVALNESAGKSIDYKYVLFHGKDQQAQRENCTTRTRAIPETGVSKWRDTWEGRSHPY
jgi:cyclomaltodextrin glucanotransferase